MIVLFVVIKFVGGVLLVTIHDCRLLIVVLCALWLTLSRWHVYSSVTMMFLHKCMWYAQKLLKQQCRLFGHCGRLLWVTASQVLLWNCLHKLLHLNSVKMQLLWLHTRYKGFRKHNSWSTQKGENAMKDQAKRGVGVVGLSCACMAEHK